MSATAAATAVSVATASKFSEQVTGEVSTKSDYRGACGPGCTPNRAGSSEYFEACLCDDKVHQKRHYLTVEVLGMSTAVAGRIRGSILDTASVQGGDHVQTGTSRNMETASPPLSGIHLKTVANEIGSSEYFGDARGQVASGNTASDIALLGNTEPAQVSCGAATPDVPSTAPNCSDIVPLPTATYFDSDENFNTINSDISSLASDIWIMEDELWSGHASGEDSPAPTKDCSATDYRAESEGADSEAPAERSHPRWSASDAGSSAVKDGKSRGWQRQAKDAEPDRCREDGGPARKVSSGHRGRRSATPELAFDPCSLPSVSELEEECAARPPLPTISEDSAPPTGGQPRRSGCRDDADSLASEPECSPSASRSHTPVRRNHSDPRRALSRVLPFFSASLTSNDDDSEERGLPVPHPTIHGPSAYIPPDEVSCHGR
ncbi:uncharacterized protein LOC126346894 [Schistocerca gregaria]|uniref:uncharacterized protein LOC126346894 n=1 Tax=Schistocerca gregaria TaxID=7010 RepID=UPI00211E5EA5|nr:uncharacterized protein LOC126346894 [Schistocerca gregaria]